MAPSRDTWFPLHRQPSTEGEASHRAAEEEKLRVRAGASSKGSPGGERAGGWEEGQGERKRAEEGGGRGWRAEGAEDRSGGGAQEGASK